jgi:prevent-host-death family protein
LVFSFCFQLLIGFVSLVLFLMFFRAPERPFLMGFMREIQASEVKTHLPRLLDAVERGETLIITRHGRAIARIVPEVDRQQAKIDEGVEAIRRLRRRAGPITVDELLSARHEGRRF